MDIELNSTLKSLKEKTELEIDVFSENKTVFASTGDAPSASYPENDLFDDVFCDAKANKTYFKMRYKKLNLIGVLNGSDASAKNYAHLIASVVEAAVYKDSEPGREDEIKNMLAGESNRSQIQKFMIKYGVPDVSCFVLVLFAGGRAAELNSFLTQYIDNEFDASVMMEDMSCAFLKFLDKESENEYQSPSEYAGFLVQSVYEELGIKVKIGVGGTVRHLQDCAQSYQQAATALRMSATFSGKGSVHNYKEYILIKMLEDVPQIKLREYFDILLDGEARTIFNDEDMINTAEEFLENSLNISETSRNLYMHRNTLMYRLDKIEKITGLNIRKFSDAVSFRLLTILYNLLS